MNMCIKTAVRNHVLIFKKSIPHHRSTLKLR